MAIQAIETRYAGCHFRSRLEARWAVFFDTLGIKWEYEPQGFELPSGQRYLPDFWLPKINTWYEVKGVKPENEDKKRLEEFCQAIPGTSPNWKANQYLKIAVGDIPDPRTISTIAYKPDGSPDLHYQERIYRLINMGDRIHVSRRTWVKCTRGHTWVGWEWCWHCTDIEGAMALTGNKRHPDIIAAYKAARSARFEHGQTPVQPIKRTSPSLDRPTLGAVARGKGIPRGAREAVVKARGNSPPDGIELLLKEFGGGHIDHKRKS